MVCSFDNPAVGGPFSYMAAFPLKQCIRALSEAVGRGKPRPDSHGSLSTANALILTEHRRSALCSSEGISVPETTLSRPMPLKGPSSPYASLGREG